MFQYQHNYTTHISSIYNVIYGWTKNYSVMDASMDRGLLISLSDHKIAKPIKSIQFLIIAQIKKNILKYCF